MGNRRPTLWKVLGYKESRVGVKVGFFKKFTCDVCSSKFSHQEDMMNHKQIVHGKDLQYDCKECKKYFSNMEDMRTHLQREHSYKKDR
jgi:KRAB domain-containing zinc finger protein